MKIKEIFQWKYLVSLLFSMILAFFITVDSKLVYSGNVFGLATENYIHPFKGEDVVIWLMLTIVCWCLCFCLAHLYQKYCKKLFIRSEQDAVFKPKKFFVCVSLIYLVAWLPYVISYLPGSVYSDTYSSFEQALSGIYYNHHPILYSYLLGIFLKTGMKIGGTLESGILTCTLVQTVIMILIMAYFSTWVYKKNVRFDYCVLMTAFIALFPLFPFYAVAVWKDTPFSLAVLLYVLYSVDIAKSDGQILKSFSGIIKYIVLTFFVCFLRNNGIYICLFSFVIVTLAYWRQFRSLWKFEVCAVLTLIITLIIQGPVYSALKLSTETVESLGITNQQIFAVFTSPEGEWSEEDEAFISKVWNIEEIPQKYTPALADTPKLYMDWFDMFYLDDHLDEYFKTWMRLGLKNPGIYVEAWLMETMSFWSLTHGGWEAYIQLGVWPNSMMEIEERDLFHEVFGWSFGGTVQPDDYIVPGSLFWMAMFSMIITVINAPRGKNFKLLVPLSGVIALWLTLMIATPIAVSLRYAYAFVLVLPLLPVLPGILDNN